MSPLHERTQKQICRSAFFALCVLPTLGTFAWIVWRQLPWQEASWQRRLSGALELDVELQGTRESRPGRFRVRRLALSLPHNRDPLLEMQGVDAVCRRDKLLFGAKQATLQVDQIVPACRLVADRFARRKVPLELSIVAATLAWQAPLSNGDQAAERSRETLDVTNLFIRWFPADGESTHAMRLQVQANVPGSASLPETACHLVWTRRGEPTPVDSVRLDASRAALPVGMLNEAVLGWGQFAPATFTGVVQWQATTLDSQGDASGALCGFPIQPLLGLDSVHRMRGQTAINLARYAWRGAQLENATGSLRIEQGRMSRTLWEAAIQQLACTSPRMPPFDAVASDVPFDQIACRFELDRRGLAIRGDCSTENPAPQESVAEGTLAVRDGRSLLLHPPYDRLPAGAWISFLSRPGLPPSWVPGTREAIETARRLPLPE